jgi:hypothetical protein
MWLALRQFDEIVTVARHHEAIVFVRELHDGWSGASAGSTSRNRRTSWPSSRRK